MSQSTYPAVELLWEKYSYNPFTGTLHKRKSGIHVKGYANTNKRTWFINLTWNGNRIQTSYGRVVYAWCTGAWPIQQVDHINRNVRDNRIHNLREVSCRQNIQNRGNFGGTWVARHQKWQAQIRIQGKVKWLGYHPTQADAVAAYWQAVERYGLADVRTALSPHRE